MTIMECKSEAYILAVKYGKRGDEAIEAFLDEILGAIPEATSAEYPENRYERVIAFAPKYFGTNVESSVSIREERRVETRTKEIGRCNVYSREPHEILYKNAKVIAFVPAEEDGTHYTAAIVEIEGGFLRDTYIGNIVMV